MLFLSAILNAEEENCTNTLRQLLRILKVKVSNTGIKKIKEHPDYPSMLSLSDMLSEWKVENAAFKISPDKIGALPTPFIAQMQTEHESQFFTVVKEYEKDNVVVSHPVTGEWRTMSREQFLQQSTGVVMLAESQKDSEEKAYRIHTRKERWQLGVRSVAIAIILLLCCMNIVQSFYVDGIAGWLPSTILSLKLLGCYIGVLLLWYEIDSYNPALQKVCRGSKNVNCGAILKSDAAKIFGFSWSEIGFLYFAGGMVTLLVGSLSPISLWVIAWLNVIAVPYTLFSIYYQWRIAKQWCVLCLTVQGILIAELMVSSAGGLHAIASFSAITFASVSTVALCLILPALCWFAVKPLLQSFVASKRNKIVLARLKYNAPLFDVLLHGQKSIKDSTEGLGIVVGNPDATNKIVKVCSPYCGPCASAHSVLDELLENNSDTQLQIIFTVTNDEKDFRAIVAKHLMAIADKNDNALTMQALNDWYLAAEKDYEVFAEKYPTHGTWEKQDQQVEAMSAWCKKTEISFTPTIFINGYQLPEIYSVEDLKYFLPK